jgi:hypothetical protein
MIGLMAVYGKDGFTDEERPYEFGFNIEGYQHRHEKKGIELGAVVLYPYTECYNGGCNFCTCFCPALNSIQNGR